MLYVQKKSLVATERLRARVKHLRQEWLRYRIPKMRAHPDRLVFIPSRDIAAQCTVGQWTKTSVKTNLTHESLIAPCVIKGAMDGEAFAAYIRQVLAPELVPGTVVICDNLATHRNKDAAQALKDVGCWFLYLPPNSPDLNPIEMAF